MDTLSIKTSYAEMIKNFAALLRVILNLGGKDTLSIKTSYEDRQPLSNLQPLVLKLLI
jgi:hypothetical protein